jgi:F0F1-type ATP synthase membrane subunit a
MEIIIETIVRIIWAIVGGTISLAFVLGVSSALTYMFYYILRYGWKAFNQEFMPR